MNRFSLWVAALALSCLIALVTSQNAPPSHVLDNSETICRSYSEDGSLNIGRVFDMSMILYSNKIPAIGTEKVKEFMRYADDDHNDVLSIAECQKLIAYLNTLAAKKDL